MSVLVSLLLGLVQGIAEFLPISSSGHLSLLQNLFNIDYTQDGHLFFSVLLHLGTLISICFVYYKDIRAMISDSIDFLRGRSDEIDNGSQLKPSVRLTMLVIVGTLPLFLVLFFIASVERLFNNTAFIGFAMIITGGILFASDKMIVKGSKTEKTMTVKDALIIGLTQAVAVIPGLSRVGSTIAVGLVRGLDKDFSVRFSLLLSLPAVLGSALVAFFDALKAGLDLMLIPIYLAGFAVATAVGCIAILVLRRFVVKDKFALFSFYCWSVGLLSFILSFVL